MPKVTTYTVVPNLPDKIARLGEIAQNLWWCWDPEAVQLFFRIDRTLWEEISQNPVKMLGMLPQERLDELAEDESFLAHQNEVYDRLQEYLKADPWREKHPDMPGSFCAAYFSAEFGLHESVCIYSGGLGLLAGDHLKSASDIGLPLIGVGLFYREGYHRQYLNADGWQQELYPRNDVHSMPLSLVKDDSGEPLIIELPIGDRNVHARIWRVNVGRVPLFLLDTDFAMNVEDDREITGQLYGGDREMRIRQEVLLGMGGVIALHTMGIHPSVYHMNEGHSAFMTLQRVRELLARGLELPYAFEAVKAASVFTTHTPVPAGNDMFHEDLIKRYLSRWCAEVGVSHDELMAIGRQNPADNLEPFCMTVLAIKLSSASNGVSKLHGEVARGMWARTFPGFPEHEVPITSITNGVHPTFWVSRDLQALFDRYLGPGWRANPSDQEIWDNVDTIPNPEFWRIHLRRRERLVAFARRHMQRQLSKRNAPHSEIQAAATMLDPEALTIGFARRFATYKRATLLLRDADRLEAILKSQDRPVQFVLAGKAHPQDHQGKELIRNLVHFTRERGLEDRFVFLEDYDINIARYMVQGVDCWLNTPRRPMEASGTSGMKAALNGGLNISIPDGWWCEAEHLGANGWSIGRGESYENPEEQDWLESDLLYDLLEHDIIPTYYDEGRDRVPTKWVNHMKAAIRTIAPVFNTHRMVSEYADRFYVPVAQRREKLRSDEWKELKIFADWKQQVRDAWGDVRIVDYGSGPTDALRFGSKLEVHADVELGRLTPDDIRVQVYTGDVDTKARIRKGDAIPMNLESENNGVAKYTGSIRLKKTGQHGFAIRVIPSHPQLFDSHEMALVTWA